jgi:F0F1-type ATP synthase delta subunit
MEVLASELAKVSSKALSTHAVQESTLDAYLAQLEALKASFAGSDLPDAANAIALHKSSNAALQDASKDYYNVLNKFNKSVDKVRW